MTPNELAAIRADDKQYGPIGANGEHIAVRQRRALLAHIDAITEAVEDALHDHGEPAGDGCEHCETNIAVLALLRGTWMAPKG